MPTNNKCECGGTKLVSSPSLSAPLYLGQYDYCCDKCGKTGIGWSFGEPAVTSFEKVVIPDDRDLGDED